MFSIENESVLVFTVYFAFNNIIFIQDNENQSFSKCELQNACTRILCGMCSKCEFLKLGTSADTCTPTGEDKAGGSVKPRNLKAA